MISSKGGAPSIPKKQRDKDLQTLGLFNRDSAVYLTMESELEALTPAKAFDLFCHYCARRDRTDAYVLVEDIPQRLKAIIEQRKNMLMQNRIGILPGQTISSSLLSYRKKLYDFSEVLRQLCHLSEHTFVTYMDLLYLDYDVSLNKDNLSTNSFSFDITASFSWGYLSHYYNEEQREKIYVHIFNEHLQQSEELREIYECSSDKASIKALHTLLILNNQRVAITDVTDNTQSPFYLEDRTVLESMLMLDRYNDVEYAVSDLPPKNSSKAISYQPNATIQLNMDKPIDYIQEMLFALKDDWVENNSYLVSEERPEASDLVKNGIEIPAAPAEEEETYDLLELRQLVMRFNKKQKTLAGKLTDLLYVHDCRRFGFTNPWTRDQMYSYWRKTRPKGEHGDSMSSSTHSNYLQLINTMIDQKYYKNY